MGGVGGMKNHWRECRLGDVLTLKRGHDLPGETRIEGEVPVVSSSGITGFHNEAKAKAPGVLTGRYGTIGEVFYLAQAACGGAMGRFHVTAAQSTAEGTP